MITIKIDPEKLTLGDICAFEEAGAAGKMASVRDILARFVVEENGKRMSTEKAVEELNKLTMPELSAVIDDLNKQIEEQASPSPISGQSN